MTNRAPNAANARFANLPDNLVRAVARMHPAAATRLASLNRGRRAAVANVVTNQRQRAARVGRQWRDNALVQPLLRSVREIGMILSQPDRDAACAVARALNPSVRGCRYDKRVYGRMGSRTVVWVSGVPFTTFEVTHGGNRYVVNMSPGSPPRLLWVRGPDIGTEPLIFTLLRDAWHVMFNPDGNLAPRPSPYDMRVTRRDLQLTPKETALLQRVGAAPSRFPLKRRARTRPNTTPTAPAGPALVPGRNAPFAVLWGPGRANRTSVRNRAMHAARHPAVAS